MKYPKAFGWFGLSVGFMFLQENNFFLSLSPAPLLEPTMLIRNLCYSHIAQEFKKSSEVFG